MSSDPDRPRPPVNPRPGVVKTLGICNVVFAVLTGLCFFSSMAWMLAMSTSRTTTLKVEVRPAAQPAPPGSKTMVAFNPWLSMDDPKFVRFCYIDAGTGVIVNGIMFATGVGLINLRRWGARWWTVLAWTKIVRLFLLWGFYIIAVAPSLSETMARNVMVMIQQQSGGRGRMPPIGQFIRIYSIMNLVAAVSVIGFGVIYPALSIWLLGRPGVKAALVDKPEMEPELP